MYFFDNPGWRALPAVRKRAGNPLRKVASGEAKFSCSFWTIRYFYCKISVTRLRKIPGQIETLTKSQSKDDRRRQSFQDLPKSVTRNLRPKMRQPRHFKGMRSTSEATFLVTARKNKAFPSEFRVSVDLKLAWGNNSLEEYSRSEGKLSTSVSAVNPLLKMLKQRFTKY